MPKSAPRVFSFPPVTAKNPYALVLGSMPGVKSLAEAQYYAHPRNAFWQVMGDMFGQPVGDYAQRCRLIRQNHLALWDVMAACERRGSLDSAIVDSSIRPNDIAGFLTAHPHITHIFLNGGKAAREFNKRVFPQLPDALRRRVTIVPLPSTSPAHARLTLQDKKNAWLIVGQAVEKCRRDGQ